MKKKTIEAPCLTAVLGHNGSVYLQMGTRKAPKSGPSAWFYNGVRTLTGVRGKHDQLECWTASEVKRKLRLRPHLKAVGDFVVFDCDEYGIFNHVTAHDVRRVMESPGGASVRYTVTLPLGVLRQLVNGK